MSGEWTFNLSITDTKAEIIQEDVDIIFFINFRGILKTCDDHFYKKSLKPIPPLTLLSYEDIETYWGRKYSLKQRFSICQCKLNSLTVCYFSTTVLLYKASTPMPSFWINTICLSGT